MDRRNFLGARVARVFGCTGFREACDLRSFANKWLDTFLRPAMHIVSKPAIVPPCTSKGVVQNLGFTIQPESPGVVIVEEYPKPYFQNLITLNEP